MLHTPGCRWFAPGRSRPPRPSRAREEPDCPHPQVPTGLSVRSTRLSPLRRARLSPFPRRTRLSPLRVRARPKTLTFSMAKTLTFSMAIDTRLSPLRRVQIESPDRDCPHSKSPAAEAVQRTRRTRLSPFRDCPFRVAAPKNQTVPTSPSPHGRTRLSPFQVPTSPSPDRRQKSVGRAAWSGRSRQVVLTDSGAWDAESNSWKRVRRKK